jgi:hypothetical protein
MAKFRWDTKEPCGSCPYRKDSKLGLWHPSEFDNLKETEADDIGSVFACHATKKYPSVCAGWLLLQRANDVPSIALRLHLHRNPKAAQCLRTVTDGGHELYGSVEEMIAANEALGRCDCGRYLGEDGTCEPCSTSIAR